MKELFTKNIVGLIVGGVLVIFLGVSYEFYQGIKQMKQDHITLGNVVSFLNEQIEKSQPPAQTPPTITP